MNKLLILVAVLTIASPSNGMQDSVAASGGNPFAAFDNSVIKKIVDKLDTQSCGRLRCTYRFFNAKVWQFDKKFQVSLPWDYDNIDYINEDLYWQKVLRRVWQIESMISRFNAQNSIELNFQNPLIRAYLTYLSEELKNTRYVRGLNLSGHHVTLLQLEQLPRLLPLLQYLNLHNQQLGALPFTLKQLTSLQSLIVSQNRLRGEHLCHIPSSVTSLVLNFNELSRLPDLHEQLPSLRSLELVGNELSTSDLELLEPLAGQLEGLYIYIFQKLPRCLAKFKKLRDLDLMCLNMKPENLGLLTQLKSLRCLNLRVNALAELEKLQIREMFPDSVEIIF